MADLILVIGALTTRLGASSPYVKGGDILLAMASIRRSLHETHYFVCSCARRQQRRRKLAEVVTHEHIFHPLATASKLVASLPINWRHFFVFHQKLYSSFYKIPFSRGESRGSDRLKNITVQNL